MDFTFEAGIYKIFYKQYEKNASENFQKWKWEANIKGIWK